MPVADDKGLIRRLRFGAPRLNGSNQLNQKAAISPYSSLFQPKVNHSALFTCVNCLWAGWFEWFPVFIKSLNLFNDADVEQQQCVIWHAEEKGN